MKNAICFFTFCLFFSFCSFSQIGVNTKKNAEEAQELKNRPLLVVLRETDKEKDKEKILKFNENFKIALEKVWTYSNIERYINYDEWRDIEKDKSQKDKYAIMHYTERDLQGNAPALCLGIGIMENKILTHFVDLNSKDDALSDMIIALITLQSDLDLGKLNSSKIKEQSGKIGELLSNKTLLISDEEVSDKLKNEISEIYPHNYKFATKEEIENVIINKDEKYLYMVLIQVKGRPTVSTGKGYKEVSSSGYPFISIIDPSKYEFIYRYFYRGKDGISSKDIENLLKLKF